MGVFYYQRGYPVRFQEFGEFHNYFEKNKIEQPLAFHGSAKNLNIQKT